MRAKALFPILLTLMAIVFIGCPNPVTPPSDVPPPVPETLLASEYLNTTPGTSIRYKITYPSNYNSSKIDYISLTFQSVNSTETTKRFFVTTNAERDSSASLTIDASGIRSNGGSTRTPGSILMQKLHLPTTIKKIGTTEWNVTSAWHGEGTYLVSPISSFTVGSDTYLDCLKVEFPNTKLSYNGQKGHGYYVLAKNIGIVYYEATLDEDGSIGLSGEKIIYESITTTLLEARELILRITDTSGNPQGGSFLDFNYGYGPQIVSDSEGVIQIPIFIYQEDCLGTLTIYLSRSNGRGEYVKNIPTSHSQFGSIDLGDVDYSLPDFSTVSVSLSPTNGANGVSPLITKLIVTFSAPMSPGWSWISFDDLSYPTTTGTPIWISDTQIELPVSLTPGKSYLLGLNSPVYLNFRDILDKPIQPIIWTFSTSP